MTFDPERKIRWENLAPSLQSKIKILAQEIIPEDINNPVSKIYKAIENLIVNQINNPTEPINNAIISIIRESIATRDGVISKTIDDKLIKALKHDNNPLDILYTTLHDFMIKIINDGLTGEDLTSLLYSTIKPLIFTNINPKIGFLDETKVPIYGMYNMNASYGHGFSISDIEGREVIFKRCANTLYKPLEVAGVFRATRENSDEDFVWENVPIVPKFITTFTEYKASPDGPLYDSVKVTEIYALTNEYAVLEVYFKEANIYKHYVVMTKGSGSCDNWEEYYLIQADVFANDIKKYRLSSFCRVNTGKNVYYLTFHNMWYNNAGPIPVGETTVSYPDHLRDDYAIRSVNPIEKQVNGLQLFIYRAVENATDHTSNLTRVRTDTLFKCGFDAICTGYEFIKQHMPILYPYSGMGPQLIYMPDKGCFFFSIMVFGGILQYSNNTSTYVKNKVIEVDNYMKLCSIYYIDKDIELLLSNTDNHFFESEIGRVNWSRPPQDMMKHITYISNNGDNTVFTYDKFTQRMITVESANIRKCDFIKRDMSTFKIRYFDTDTNDKWDKYRVEFSSQVDSIKDYYNTSESIKRVESYSKVIDTPNYYNKLNKSISDAYIDDDVIIAYDRYNTIRSTDIINLFDIEELIDPNIEKKYNDVYATIDEYIKEELDLKGKKRPDDRYKCRIRVDEGMDSYNITYDAEKEGLIAVYKEKKVNYTNNTFYNYTINTIFEDNESEVTEFSGKKIHPMIKEIYGRDEDIRIVGRFYDPNTKKLTFAYFIPSPIRTENNVTTVDFDNNSIYINFLVIEADGTYKNYSCMDMTITNISYSENVKNDMINKIKTIPVSKQLSETGFYSNEAAIKSCKSYFMDSDGTFILPTIYYSGLGKGDAGIYGGSIFWYVNIPNKTVTIFRNCSSTAHWQFGYSKSYKYYTTWNEPLMSNIVILSTRDKITGKIMDNVKKLEDWVKLLNYRDDNFYADSPLEKFNVLTNKAIYRIIPAVPVNTKSYTVSDNTIEKAYIAKKVPIYLGGYFSYLEKSGVGISLNEGDNYIYIRRDKRSFKLSIEVYDRIKTKPDDLQFNRILVTYIKVFNKRIIYQNYYDITYYKGNETKFFVKNKVRAIPPPPPPPPPQPDPKPPFNWIHRHHSSDTSWGERSRSRSRGGKK